MTKKGVATVVGSGIVILVGLVFWCRILPWPWCPWCPPRPPVNCDVVCPVDCEEDCPVNCVEQCPPATTDATIILEDIHTSIWMHMENSWVGELGAENACADGDGFGDCQGSYEAVGTYRPGVMFQLGQVYKSSVGWEAYLTEIKLTFADPNVPPESLKVGDFDWLDVNAAGRDCPIDAHHAYQLFENSRVAVPCDLATHSVACTDANPTNLSTCSLLSGGGASCLRGRTIHASFKPDIGLVTVWPWPEDPDGAGPARATYYTMDTHIGKHDQHAEYVFNLKEPVTVDVWKDGCFQSPRRTGVTEIRIAFGMPGQTHNEFHDKPMNGGRP